MMELIPIIFVAFKGLVLATGMFFAVKWHYDQGTKRKAREAGALLRASGTVAALFVLSLLGLGLATMVLGRMLGLDLSYP